MIGAPIGIGGGISASIEDLRGTFLSAIGGLDAIILSGGTLAAGIRTATGDVGPFGILGAVGSQRKVAPPCPPNATCGAQGPPALPSGSFLERIPDEAAELLGRQLARAADFLKEHPLLVTQVVALGRAIAAKNGPQAAVLALSVARQIAAIPEVKRFVRDTVQDALEAIFGRQRGLELERDLFGRRIDGGGGGAGGGAGDVASGAVLDQGAGAIDPPIPEEIGLAQALEPGLTDCGCGG